MQWSMHKQHHQQELDSGQQQEQVSGPGSTWLPAGSSSPLPRSFPTNPLANSTARQLMREKSSARLHPRGRTTRSTRSTGSRYGRTNANTRAHAYQAVGYLLNQGEAISMEGWADAAVTLSIYGYGPAYRLPQQLLLGSAVLKMSSPYQTWLDWVLLPGVHYAEFAYDLSDVVQQGLMLLYNTNQQIQCGFGVPDIEQTGSSAWQTSPKSLATAARLLVMQKLSIFAQLHAFAWSVARYKEACPWDVEQPSAGDSTWRLLQFGPVELFASKGVPESVHVSSMLLLKANFELAFKRPAYAALLKQAVAHER